MPDMSATGQFARQDQSFDILQADTQRLRIPAARLDLLHVRRHLGQSQARLEVSHPVVLADHLVLVARPHALVAQDPKTIGDRVVVGRDHSALGGREVLRCIEREATHTETAGASPVERRSVGLSGVLDHSQTVFRCQRHQGAHVRRLSVQMNRHQNLRAVPDSIGSDCRVDVEVGLGDIGKPRGRACLENCIEGGHERERRGQNLVTWLKILDLESRDQRRRAVVHRHRVSRAHQRRELVLEPLHLGSLRDDSRSQSVQHLALDFFPERDTGYRDH